MATTVDTGQVETKVKAMYRQVALALDASFHFELGEPVALRVGYAADRLATVPADSLASFAGVGHFFDLADLAAGETVADLGSGSGTDVFYADTRSVRPVASSALTSPRSSWRRPGGSRPRPAEPTWSSARAASKRSPSPTPVSTA
jgi:hypothetical protein